MKDPIDYSITRLNNNKILPASVINIKSVDRNLFWETDIQEINLELEFNETTIDEINLGILHNRSHVKI